MDDIVKWTDEHGVLRTNATERTHAPRVVTSFSMPYGGGTIVPAGYRLGPAKSNGKPSLVKIEGQ